MTVPNLRVPRVLAVQSDATAPPARGGAWINQRGVEIEVVHAWQGDPLPDSLAGYDGLMVLGGAMGAEDDHVADWLPQLRRLMREAVEADHPVLGLCLGLQLIAAACGGVVALGQTPEFGLGEIELTAAGRADSLMGHLPDRVRVPQFHRDGVPTPPPGAVVLATSALYPVQAIRMGTRVYAVQGHPEIDSGVLADWGSFEEADILEGSGRSLEHAVDELRAAEDELRDSWQPFFEAWAALVIDHAAVSSE